MQSRPLSEDDLELLQHLHTSSGFDYQLPDLRSPLFVAKRGVYERGRLVGAGGLRLQAEAYLWLDPALPVRVRYQVVLLLSRSLAEAAWRVGVDFVVAALPPGLPSSFKRLLTRLGWSRDRDGWEHWSKPIK